MREQLRLLTRSALALGLILLSISVFRGPLNLLNGILVPLILSLLTVGLSPGRRVALTLAVVLPALLWQPVQLFFLLVYLIMGWRLSGLPEETGRTGTLIRLVPLTAAGFFLALWATDLVFMTRSLEVLWRIAGENSFRLTLVIGLEALVASAVLMFLYRGIRARLRKGGFR